MMLQITMNLFPEQHPENWAKEIKKEWKILEKDLPGELVLCSYCKIACNTYMSYHI